MKLSEKPSIRRRALRPIADRLEAMVGRSVERPDLPPLIILGPPRSGTTLVYQAMVSRYKLSYFCNLAERYYDWPCLATWLERKHIRRERNRFESRFGRVSGRHGPSEARKLWSTWFTYHCCDEHVQESSVSACRHAVANAVRCVGYPFVTKNPDHCIRIPALELSFPDAIYLRVTRNPAETARSILNARATYLGSYDRWFGVRPPEVPAGSGLDPVEEVVRQVHYLDRRIDEAFESAVEHNRQVTIDYADFCNNPARSLAAVEHVARSNGLALESRANTIPAFTPSSGRLLPPAMESRMAGELASLYP